MLNAFTGMMTELRARRMIDKLNLMNQDQISVVRDGQLVSIDPKDIVLDDACSCLRVSRFPVMQWLLMEWLT